MSTHEATSEMSGWDPRAEHTAEDWARMAAERANVAANHALSAHQEIGGLTGEVVSMRGEISQLRSTILELRTSISGLKSSVSNLVHKTKKTEQSLHDLQEAAEDDPADNTQIRDLKKQIRATNRSKKFWSQLAIGFIVATASVVAGAAVLRYLHW